MSSPDIYIVAVTARRHLHVSAVTCTTCALCVLITGNDSAGDRATDNATITVKHIRTSQTKGFDARVYIKTINSIIYINALFDSLELAHTVHFSAMWAESIILFERYILLKHT